MVVIFANF
uniref:Uncharacterized protein n=1 Tax=Arundo donax TaxID=35708 RepID=A0A0A8YF18_ARUDO